MNKHVAEAFRIIEAADQSRGFSDYFEPMALHEATEKAQIRYNFWKREAEKNAADAAIVEKEKYQLLIKIISYARKNPRKTIPRPQEDCCDAPEDRIKFYWKWQKLLED